METWPICRGSLIKKARKVLPNRVASSIRNGAQLLGQPEKPQEASEINMGVLLAGFGVSERKGQWKTPKPLRKTLESYGRHRIENII